MRSDINTRTCCTQTEKLATVGKGAHSLRVKMEPWFAVSVIAGRVVGLVLVLSLLFHVL